MAAPTHVAPPSAATSAPPPPPPPPPPAIADVGFASSRMEADDVDEDESDEEQREFLLNALDVAGDWSAHDDGDGRLFYYNRRTRASQWAPPEGFTGLEGELMMKLMLEGAVARSGHWTAHDAGNGNGTLYYFNAKTRESVWERPSDWGVLPPPPPPPTKPQSAKIEGQSEAKADEGVVQGQEEANADADKSAKKKKDKKKRKKSKKKEKEASDEHGGGKEASEQHADGPAIAEGASEQAPADEPNEEEEVQEDPEELEAAKRREEAHMRHIAQFRAMLREKNIMPFCRWSVALPQIAGDPRFMGISTMDERREIFEHFVKHRREDLKAEKKQKIKQAKKLFEDLLVDQFKDSWVDAKTTLSVFLAALEDHVDAARYKQLQDESLAYLTIDIQEKLYTKAMSEFQADEPKRDKQAKRLTAFLEKEMAKEVLSWDDPKAQGLVDAFYASEASSTAGALLSAEKQQQVFRDVAQRLRATQEQTSPSTRPDAGRHHQSREEPNSPSENRRRRDRDRGRSSSRSRSHSRRRESRRDRSKEDDRRHRHSSRGRRRDSRSHSRSRSRSRRHHGRSRHGRRSSSSSRSRSHSRRRR